LLILSLLPATLQSPTSTPTFEADIQGHPRQRGIDDVTQIHLLLLIEVELPAPTRSETERDELLSVEAVKWLYQEREGAMLA
jgi:hypothetical protein